MRHITFKSIQYCLMLITFLVLASSFYFQYAMGLQPCPLCLMQRLCVFLLLTIIFFSFFTYKVRLLSYMQLLFSCAGLYFALRQLWLQTLPEGMAPACMPGLDVLIKYFPWQTVAHALFWGSGECGQVSWQLLGISMPGWSALYFIFMAFTSLLLVISKPKVPKNVQIFL